MSRFVIAGATGGMTQGAAAPNRVEINDFVKIQDQFSLYIQALQAMQSDNQDQILSFFQIAGIHGLPYLPWDESDSEPVSSDGWGGYCVHGSVLFPTWHRPYLMLYEQVLQQHATAIAETYAVDQERWKKAAADLRQPFWDWASNMVPPPEVISLEKVTIITPDGSETQVDNPLIRYKFHPIDQSFPQPYNGWKSTLRWPTNGSPNARDNVSRLRRVLRNAQSDVTSKTYNLLTRVQTWPAFSNHSVGDGGSSSNSLEGIHDGIHVDVGGNGQMSDPSVAAFDPIFFLHHCNVDRLLSLWTALHPTVWVTSGSDEDGTFTIPPGSSVDSNSALTPFWNAQTSYWASKGIEITSKLGYTYPEFNNLDGANPATIQSAISDIVNNLYQGSIFTSLAATSALVPEIATVASASAPLTQQTATVTDIAPVEGEGDSAQIQISIEQPTGDPSQGMWEWTAHVTFKKYELGCSFSVLFFLGNVPEDPEDWRISPKFVGATHAFVNSAAGQCANCRQQPDLQIEGFVHLNEGIAKHSNLNSFEPSVVEPYLRRELHWRVQKIDGAVAQLHSLEVTVIATPLSLLPGAAFPVPGERQHYHGITHGRPGGSRQGPV